MKIANVRVTTAPLVEPVALEETKLHLRVDADTEDDVITRLITAARKQCEFIAHRAFITQTLTATLDDWPSSDVIELPYAPLQTIVSISYLDYLGAEYTMPAADYIVDTASEPGRICLAYDANWPTESLQPRAGITIEYEAGYGDAASDVPAIYRQAILLLVGHYYENREDAVIAQGLTPIMIPQGVKWLLLTDRG